jgi:hypothetical protein
MGTAAQQPRPLANPALRPEYRLLLACAAGTSSLERRAEIEGLIEGGLDWRLVLETARAQLVTALCYPAFQELAGAAVPAETMAAFRAEAMATAARNLHLSAKLLEIDERAEAGRIALVPYKGAMLAEMAYGSPGLRQFVDLDFILRQLDLPAAWRLLESLGYRPANPALGVPGAPIPGEYVFLSAENDVQVELHTELTLRHFPVPPDLDSLIAGREPVTLLGRTVLTFSREDTLPLLAVHGAKDFWAQLLWISDIARLIEAPGFDWQRALERADRMGCRRMANVALLLASETLAAPMPKTVLGAARADARARAEAQWLAGRIFEPSPIGRREQLRYRMRMVEGFWPGLRYAARLATTPADDDWNAVRLPAPLGFAYTLLRPLRLFRR